MEKIYAVYILTNRYTGSSARVSPVISGRGFYQHHKKVAPGFTTRYNVTRLVYYETGYDASGAISHEKQIKACSRRKKIDLVDTFNPKWRDLYEQL